MFISIITPTFNSEKTLRDCLLSVKNQNFNDYEHIIMDNLSQDNSISIAKQFKFSKMKILSEKDNGIYDAMNKGIKIAQGDYLLFLNSDDIIIDKLFLTKAKNILENKNIDILYSNILYSKNLLSISRKFIPGNKDNIKKFGFHLPHPGTIIKKDYINNIGIFDLNFKIAADFDFFIRAKKNKYTIYYYYNNFTILMSPGGASSGLKNIISANIECYESLKKNKVSKPFLFIFVKIFYKFFQFFK